MASYLFDRKPISQLISESTSEDVGLKRVLDAKNLVFLGVGAIIGAGIFVLTGQVASQYAGPAIVISFLMAGVVCGFAALCYAEFASMIPIAGSAYTYAYATLGELWAWIIGWDLLLEYLFGAGTVAVGWSGYIVSFLADLGIIIPRNLANAPFNYDASRGWFLTGATINLPAVLMILGLTGLLVIGIKESSRFNNLIVFIKILVILLFVVFGAFYINPDHWTPFIPENTGDFGHYGWSGVFRGAGIIFIAYLGFDAVSTAAQEATCPQKDMPVGILGSLAISTVLYILVALVLTGVVSYQELHVPDPIAVGVNAAGPGLMWLRPIIKIGAIAGLSSVMLVLLLGQPRILFTMARDGLLPQALAKTHARFRTPHNTTIITGLLAALIAGLFPIGILGELVSIGTLFAFVIVCSGILILRYTHPETPRPFKVPLFPLVPILGALISAAQILALPPQTWLRLVIWLMIGLTIYFSYGYRHSKLRSAGHGARSANLSP